MSIADITVRDFGISLGMPQLAFNEHGVIRLQFESAGALLIERKPQGALLQLVRPIDQQGGGILERALDLCHFEKIDRLRPDAGITHDGSLVFSVMIDEKNLDLSSLEGAFDFLRRLHDRVAG